MKFRNDIAAVYWITGLSGSGKTSVSKEFIKLLNEIGQEAINLDGDDLRKIIGGGYTKANRLKQAKKYSQLCKLFSNQGIFVVAAVGGLIRSIHNWNRLNIKNYIEVFLNVPEKQLLQRNKKKLYSDFEIGKIKNIVGLDINAEFPVNPDIEIKNYDKETPKTSAKRIFEFHKTYLKKNKYEK